jgi:anthraniloyl-CoA monooxygenase
MRVVCVGGGPGGLYTAILLKVRHPDWSVTVLERNRPDETFGFGVVFSDATLGHLRAADPATFEAITANFAHWDDIDVHYQGQRLRSTGHGFAGLSRGRLLRVLQIRARALGIDLEHGVAVRDRAHLDELGFKDIDLVVAADGLNSQLRDASAEAFGVRIDWRPNRFCWLGTSKRFPAFTFFFKQSAHGLFRVHAYNYEDGRSTFIVETTEAAWRAAGLDTADEATSRDYCATLFADELEGHPLNTNHSIWRQFPTVTCSQWWVDDVVLVGDAVHTAHFSIGSGTKLAMEDAIALADALDAHPERDVALTAYQTNRKSTVESLQRAAQISLEWFEHTERYFGQLAPEQFAYSLLTRSLRINHGNLAERDPAFIDRIQRWFDPEAGRPPMFTPFQLRGLTLHNRVVLSPMCMYSATDGLPNDFHLVHLGSRAQGGAGLLMTEMTAVSADARITPGCVGLYTDAHLDAWRRIVDFVHAQGPVAIGVQLGHAGRKGATCVPPQMDQPLQAGAWPIWAPSPVPYLPHSAVPHALDRPAMDAIRDDFVAAAQRAEAAGFDLCEVHLAHGYLLASCLSPITNQRTDLYGGDLAGRMRFPLEVVTAVRAVWPCHKPLLVRISATDWLPGGFSADDAVILARALKALGVDLIDVSTGQTDPASRPDYGRLYQTPFAERVRLEADIPTLTVGAVSSYGDANSILAAGRADLVALARMHLFDPYWTQHAAYEQDQPPTWPAQYAGALHRFTPRVEWSPRGNKK